MKLNRDFYNRDTLIVTKELIGKIIVHEYDNKLISMRITEAESYIGAIDKASHCYNNKITERTKIMFGPPGYSYVFFIYGMHFCFNIVTEKEGLGSAVLIRGAEGIDNMEEISLNRYSKALTQLTKQEIKNISNGPSKLCKAMNITKEHNGIDLTKDTLYIIDDGYDSFEIEKTKRINIDYAEEAKDFLWRFVMKKTI